MNALSTETILAQYDLLTMPSIPPNLSSLISLGLYLKMRETSMANEM